MQSQIQRPDRLEKLIPVMAIAMYWAVSCGLAEDAASPPNPASKNARSLCSLFKRGLRFFKRYFALTVRLPKLWGRWKL